MNYRRLVAALLLLSAGAGIIFLSLIEAVKAEPRSQVPMPFMRIDPGLDSQDGQGIAQAEALVPMDPVYAAREISIFPYPVMLGQPAEICVEIRNPTSEGQDVVVNFAWANFGIGLPFAPILGRAWFIYHPKAWSKNVSIGFHR